MAHGGWVGFAVEVAGALAIVALGLAFWVGNRRDGADDDE